MKAAFKTKSLSVLMFLIVLPFIVEAGGFYVVIGTFSNEAGARKLATSLRDHFSEASFTFDEKRNLYHVHVLETDRRAEAEDFRHYLQYENGFLNAWILTDIDSGDIPSEMNVPTTDNSVTLELYTGGAVLLSSSDNSYLSISKNQAQTRESIPGGSGNGFTFVAETFHGVTIPAKVSLMDRKGRPISTFRAGEIVSFGGKQEDRLLTLVCEASGYSTETRVIALNKLGQLRDVAQNSEGLWEIRFVMTKLNINKIDLLYHGIFYPDAAVFKPEAKKHIGVLVSLMQRNSGLRIEINSHCNAGRKREVMLPLSRSYFDLSDASDRIGTDKQLTRYRTESVRDYLIEHGIDPQRITVMGWGSLDTLIRDNHGNMELNERLEIELVSE